jgi:hypothetical protein
LIANLIMAHTNPTGSVAEAAEVAKKEEKKKQKQKEAKKAKTGQQKQFIELTTFDDVVVDKTNPLLKVGRGPDDTPFLQSIKAVSPTQLSICALRHFCTINGINGYKDQSKVMMCNLIID